MASKNSVKVTLRAKDYDPGQSNWQTEKHQKDNCPIIEKIMGEQTIKKLIIIKYKTVLVRP